MAFTVGPSVVLPETWSHGVVLDVTMPGLEITEVCLLLPQWILALKCAPPCPAALTMGRVVDSLRSYESLSHNSSVVSLAQQWRRGLLSEGDTLGSAVNQWLTARPTQSVRVTPRSPIGAPRGREPRAPLRVGVGAAGTPPTSLPAGAKMAAAGPRTPERRRRRRRLWARWGAGKSLSGEERRSLGGRASGDAARCRWGAWTTAAEATGPGAKGTAGRADAPPPSFHGTAGDRWRKLTDACGRRCAAPARRLSNPPRPSLGSALWRRGVVGVRGLWAWRGPHVGSGRSPSAGLCARLCSFVSRPSVWAHLHPPTWFCVSCLCVFPYSFCLAWTWQWSPWVFPIDPLVRMCVCRRCALTYIWQISVSQKIGLPCLLLRTTSETRNPPNRSVFFHDPRVKHQPTAWYHWVGPLEHWEQSHREPGSPIVPYYAVRICTWRNGVPPTLHVSYFEGLSVFDLCTWLFAESQCLALRTL